MTIRLNSKGRHTDKPVLKRPQYLYFEPKSDGIDDKPSRPMDSSLAHASQLRAGSVSRGD